MPVKSATGAPYSVFDADSHVLESAALWEEHLEPAYRVIARSSFWHERDEVGSHTILNGRLAPELPSPNIPRHAVWRPGMSPQEIGGLDPNRRHEPNPGASDPQARLDDMDALGIDQALLFLTLFAEYFPHLENPDVAQALARAYNDWILDFCRAAPKRLHPVAVLPMQDVVFAVREAKRVAALGFPGVMVRPVIFNERFPTDAHYRPLWGELESLGLAACIHPSAGPAGEELDSNAPFVERVTANVSLGHPVAEFVAPAMDNATFVVAMMAEGLMERFPKLRTALLHSGVGWLPVALEKAETYLWLSHQAEPVSLNPEGVFRHRQNLITFVSGDGTIRRTAGEFEELGAWGSRYPAHDTTTPVDAVRDLEAGGVPRPLIEKLMGGNTAKVLGIQAAPRAQASR